MKLLRWLIPPLLLLLCAAPLAAQAKDTTVFCRACVAITTPGKVASTVSGK